MKKFALLAVDDTRDNLFLLEQLVAAYLPDCELVTAKSAREALEHAGAREFDGALIDVQLPEIDGVEVCRRLKAGDNTRRLPIMLITAKESTPRLRSEGLAAGADDFVSRPIDNEELVARIRVMLRLKEAEKRSSQTRDELETRVCERTTDLAAANQKLQREIAEREQAERRLCRSERELAVRNRIAEAFLILGGDEVFSHVLDIVLETLESQHGMFGYMDETGNLVAPSMTHGAFEQCRMENKTFTFPPEAWGKSIWGRAISERRILLANTPFKVPPGHIPMNREISSPIVYQDRVIGLINVANKATDYDEHDVELLRAICLYIAPVLHARLQRDRHEQQRHQAEDALKRAHQELENRVRERTAELLNTNQQLETEIAERKRAEQALRETNALLERVFATTQMSLAYMDTNMTFIRVNRAYAEHDGHPPEYFVGKNHFQLFPHEENEAIFRRVVRTGEPVEFYAKPFTYAGNPERGISYWDWSLHPVKNTAGRAEGLLLCLVDVTQRVRAEARARQHQTELAHVSRLSTMGEMGSAIAHELNQPLCAILASAQASLRLLKTAGTGDGPILGAIEQVAAQAKRAGDIIRHLREFTRRRAFHRSTLQVAEVVREAAQFVAAEARPHNVQIDLDIPDGLPPVVGDTIQIEQVLVNLMRNGIESMEATDEKHRRLDISVRSVQPDMIEVAVRDTGRGLPAGDQDRIFEPFFSTKAEGMGIGLAISRSIVEFHGGRLWATPAPGPGAIFHFVLPTGSREEMGPTS
jgi:PAS domain S-box-containing protein